MVRKNIRKRISNKKETKFYINLTHTSKFCTVKHIYIHCYHRV